MNILYSFNKVGWEAEQWAAAISGASDEEFTFIPFNHGSHAAPQLYLDAWQLDRLYQGRHSGLMGMYAALEAAIADRDVRAMIVTHCPPYHPDFLRRLSIYKALYSGDDPDSTYKRNIPYLHGYDHVFFCDPVYSPDMDMAEKMRYAGMANADWLPLGVLDSEYDPGMTEEALFAGQRDIDIVYVGSFFRQKLDILARVKKAFGGRFRMHGRFRAKHNLYYNVTHRWPGWVREVSFQDRTRLYQRARIGFNLHWNDYGLGNQRLYLLPANGVMQICDCPAHVGRIYEPETEVVSFKDADDLIDRLRYYLDHDDERLRIARAGYRRVVRDYRFAHVTRRAGALIREGMAR